MWAHHVASFETGMLRKVVEGSRCVQALDKILNDKDKLAPKAVWTEKRRMLGILGWKHWAHRVDEQIILAFPKDFAAL
jgi:hypothetical protein